MSAAFLHSWSFIDYSLQGLTPKGGVITFVGHLAPVKSHSLALKNSLILKNGVRIPMKRRLKVLKLAPFDEAYSRELGSVLKLGRSVGPYPPKAAFGLL